MWQEKARKKRTGHVARAGAGQILKEIFHNMEI